MTIETLNKEVKKIKKRLGEKHNHDRIKMIQIDVDFLLHADINNIFKRCKTTEERLKKYLDYLKTCYKE